MNMVTNAAYTNDLAASRIDQLSYIAMHTPQMLISYFGAGALHMEDDMKISILFMLLPLQGDWWYVVHTQGDALGYGLVGLSARRSLTDVK